jgi:hypothetical protein
MLAVQAGTGHPEKRLAVHPIPGDFDETPPHIVKATIELVEPRGDAHGEDFGVLMLAENALTFEVG